MSIAMPPINVGPSSPRLRSVHSISVPLLVLARELWATLICGASLSTCGLRWSLFSARDAANGASTRCPTVLSLQLPHELCELVLRLTEPPDLDDYDLEDHLDRRRLLRAASLVCRAWVPLAQALLGETIIVRKLRDLDELETALDEDWLNVYTSRLYVDPAACGVDDPDRYEDNERDRWTLSDEAARKELVVGVGRLIDRRLEVELVGFPSAEVVLLVDEPWPVERMIIEHTDYNVDVGEDRYVEFELVEKLEAWTDLRELRLMTATKAASVAR